MDKWTQEHTTLLKVYRTIHLVTGISDSCTFVNYAVKVIFISMLRMDIATTPSPGSLQAKCHPELHQVKPTGRLAIIGISIWPFIIKWWQTYKGWGLALWHLICDSLHSAILLLWKWLCKSHLVYSRSIRPVYRQRLLQLPSYYATNTTRHLLSQHCWQ